MTTSTHTREQGDGGLRLVSESQQPTEQPEVEKQFVNFMFLRVNPEWRKLDGGTKRAYKQEFERVFDSFRGDLLLFSYSLVGFDSKADLMFWRVGSSLDLVQDMTAKLYRTEFGSYLETVDNYLSTTKRMMFVEGAGDGKFHVEAGASKYHFVYPCAKQSDWFEIPAEERDALMKENFMVGKRFPNIRIHLTHAFGFNDHEYLVSFETDEPRDFLALAEELRETPASRLSVRGMAVYTCRQRPLMECLDALG
jgi:chlorite dismutase